ncbi:leucine-rich repeat domain-containing protein [Candidatus Palauibacter sp.]|uniref:leucine-rich repeat domain-containing protein n=1 Tax=Candidatus Palauibacter sp. TaxID=3101350 RepID=UPI003C6FD3A3
MGRLALLLLLAPSLSCGEGEPSGPPPPAAPPPPPPPVATSMQVVPETLTLNALGLKGTFSARVRDQHSRPMTGLSLSWRSSAPSIATVDRAGRVTAVDNGKATISASAGSATGEAGVTVLQEAATLELFRPDTVRAYGDTARVAASAADVNGHPMAPRLLTWTSSDAGVVTVDSTGLATATGNGTASVSAASGPVEVSVDVTVNDPEGPWKSDREALMILFDNGRSHVWPRKENWGTEAPLSTWAGVSTDEDGRVTALALPGNRVWANIPPEFGRLDRLETLDLSNNDVHGAIPPELGDLERLRVLNLSRNPIRAPIPPELGQLASLEILDLGRSGRLDGPIPAELGNLAKLEVLRLDATFVHGPIPPELGGLTALRTLRLDDNHLLDGPIPAELGNLENLEVLRLDWTGLSGGIPPELGRLVKLDTLNLRNSGAAGDVPSELGNLTNLRFLGLGDRSRVYPIPRRDDPRGRIGGVAEVLLMLAERGVRLEELDIHRSTDGSIPPEIGNFTQLKRLVWTWSDLTGPIPPELGNLTNLSELVLSDSHLTGPLPPELGNLAQLRRLTLRDNDLSGPLPVELTRLTALEILTINRTDLCVPKEAVFDVWLAKIESFGGARCPDPPQ